ncbi:MAG: DNA ligase [Betaproteobacteria bacterium]|nr:DNA ligase [Betaproteobacteria bacterium]
MNSREILAAINEIAATASKNEKEALVRKGVVDANFCRVLEYAYNPFKTYGIRQIPERTTYGAGYFDEGGNTFALLDRLIARDLTGLAARDAVLDEINRLEESSAELFVRIIRKDLRAGFSESTCNKAKKGLIPDFPYMRCCLPKDAKLSSFDWKLGVVSQEKADGMFANIDREEGGIVRITSRQGSPFPVEAFDKLVDEVVERIPAGVQMHGELLVKREGEGILPREIGNGILNSVACGGSFLANEKPIYLVWDMIPLNAVATKGKCEQPYIKRLSRIIAVLNSKPGTAIRLIETKIFHSLADAYAHAGELMRRGKEGTVIKNPHAIWKDGTSKEQVKLKLEFSVDLKVVAIIPGTVGTKTEGRAGALACESDCGGVRVNVAVKNESMRDAVDVDPSDWVGRVIEVVANDIMKPSESSELHSLFLPRMAAPAYRTDKTQADSLARILAQKEAAVFGETLKGAA